MIARKLGALLLSPLLILNMQLGAKAGPEFKMLKTMLGSRQQEPKMYLPAEVLVGSDLDILVVAPGAKSIKLLASKEAGESELDGNRLRVGPDFKEIGEREGQRAEFTLKIDPTEYAEQVGKFYYFEALISYEDHTGHLICKVPNLYGSNAAFSNINAVKISEPTKSSGAANMAKALMPGFFNKNQNLQ